MTLRIDPRVRGDHVHLAASLQRRRAAVEEARDEGNAVREHVARTDLMIFETLFCVEG